ncbi:MAG: DUF1343 domain-containing protein [Bacteroidia bacterium]|nr:DUF1343 domain-containing protein [Bacteroidia bacterium]MCZ2276982.1 DUF1343 domain-containing protein [Bacteroidia bacterium]
MNIQRLLLILALICIWDRSKSQSIITDTVQLHESLKEQVVKTGADRTELYLPLIRGKTIALVVNQTSLIAKTHLIDSLLAMGIKIQRIFAPEHGFRGEADAGEAIIDGKDQKTKLPVISLYGQKKKPVPGDLTGIDIVVFDIQDVGTRFYTYISTLSLVMEACAEAKIQVLVLDRPNPNGYYIDGPVLKPGFESFVGMHPIPVVYGMTIGEYAQMVNGEGWLKNGIHCELKVIPCGNYDHNTSYSLPVKPSPNLPNMASIYLYPSLCFFEGTAISIGRGTAFPFQVIGFPEFKEGDIEFTPVSTPGVVNHPPFENQKCSGIDLRYFGTEFIRNYRGIYLFWLINMYHDWPDKNTFFNSFFNKLAGNDLLMNQIKSGVPESGIKKSWQNDIQQFKRIRGKYLLYDDFE